MKTKNQAVVYAAFFGLTIALAATGCHPISPSVIQEADQSLSFAEIRDNPDQYRGKVVVFGGTVVSTETRQNETLVEVQQKRLGAGMEPRDGDQKTGGRFLAVFPGTLDPAEYTRGRRITVGGEIEGRTWVTSGEKEMGYPLIRAMDSRLYDTCGQGLYAYSFYKDYYGGTKSPYHKPHLYNYRCR